MKKNLAILFGLLAALVIGQTTHRALVKLHERSLTTDLENGLQPRELGIDAQGLSLTAKTSTSTKINLISKQQTNPTLNGSLSVLGNFAVNLDKFTVNATTGNASVAGTLTAGATTVTSLTASGALSSASLSTGAGTFSGAITSSGAISGASANLSGLTASLPVFTDGSKNLVSGSVTGTGSSVLAASPTFTGTVSGATSTWSGALTVGGASNLANVTASGTVASTGNLSTSANLVVTGTGRFQGAAAPSGIGTWLDGEGIYLNRSGGAGFLQWQDGSGAGRFTAQRDNTTSQLEFHANGQTGASSEFAFQNNFGSSTPTLLLNTQNNTVGIPSLSSGRVLTTTTSGVLAQDNHYWDATNDALGIGAGASGSNPNDDILISKSKTIATSMSVHNTGNANATSHSQIYLSVGGPSAGDPRVRFNIPSGASWTMGADNSDADAFKISEASDLGTNDWFRIATNGAITIPGTTQINNGSSLILNYTDPTVGSNLEFKSNGNYRWALKSGATESGSNSGSNFFITGYSDAGFPYTPFWINRSTGLTSLMGLNVSDLTASQAVFTDASENLVSVATTGTGNAVRSTSPSLSGTVNISSLSASQVVGTDGSSNLTTISSTGTGNVVRTTGPTISAPTFNSTVNVSSLTASQVVGTDGSKNLTSIATTGTGSVVLAASPTLTGTLSGAAASFSGNVSAGGTLAAGGNEAFDYDEGSFTGTLTGVTTTVTGTLYFVRVGKSVTLRIPNISGTSNAATVEITGMPASLYTNNYSDISVGNIIINNGSYESGWIRISGNSIIFLRPTPGPSANSFTTSGTKGLQAPTCITYTMN